ncbi:unnamed protein product, partial [Hapterophycus canaliculatus]
AEDTETNFANIGEAILLHLKPSEPPTTRALALDVAQTFVQNVLSERSKDKRSSKIRRRAFKELLAHLIPLMLDCLKSPEGTGNSNGSVFPDGSASSIENALGGFGHGGEAGGPGDVLGVGGMVDIAGKGLGGEVVVLHYYQQHHQYLLKVAVLETMSRWV